MQVDSGRQPKFPDQISLRPDMVLISNCTKQVFFIELIVTWEDHVEEANERKRSKYQELVDHCQRRGWKARCGL